MQHDENKNKNFLENPTEGSRIVTRPEPKQHTVQSIMEYLSGKEGRASITDLLSPDQLKEAEHRFPVAIESANDPRSFFDSGALELTALFYLLCPPGRELSLAITNLEQAILWAAEAVKRN